jgi:molecular chaperone HtpG
VIYLTDPIDEYMIQNMTEYEGKKFRNVTKEGLELADSDEDKEALEKTRKDHEEMCKAIKDILEDRVVRVEVSQRITETPCVLVTDQYGLSANMERILKSQPLRKNDMMGPVRTNKVLEINVEHPIMKHIKAGIEKKDDEREQKYVKDLVNLVFEVSMVHSGFTLENPAVFSKKIFSVIGMNIAVEEEVAAEEEVNVVMEENNEDITKMESVD